MVDAYDVSFFQGSIDAVAARDAGVGLIIVKLTEGTWASNLWAPQQLGAASAAGLRLGAYHFPRPDLGTTPEVEAEVFLREAGALEVLDGSVLALDMEPYPGTPWPLDVGGTIDWTARWCDRVAAVVPGADIWWYSYPDFIRRLLPPNERIDRYGLWIADPSNYQDGLAPRTGGRTWALWQVGVESAPGVVGNVDLNMYGPSYSGSTPVAQEAPMGTLVRVNGTATDPIPESDNSHYTTTDQEMWRELGGQFVHPTDVRTSEPVELVDADAFIVMRRRMLDAEAAAKLTLGQAPPPAALDITSVTDDQLTAEIARRLAETP